MCFEFTVMKRECVLTAALLLLVSGLVRGQAAGNRLSLQRAIEQAWANNIQIKQNGLQVESSKNQLAQSRYNLLPTLNGSLSQGLNLGRSIDPFTNTYRVGTINFTSYGLSASAPVFNGFALKNTITQNRLLLAAAEQDLQANRDQIALNVVLAYLQVLNSEDLLQTARNQALLTTQQAERTRRLVEAGSLPLASQLELEAQLATDEQSIVVNETNLDIARLNLLQLMNVSESSGPLVLDRVSLDIPATDYDATVEQVYASAMGFQPALKAAELRVQGAEKGIEIARGALLPSLGFSFNFGTNFSSAALQASQGDMKTVTNQVVANIGGQDVPVTFTSQQPTVSYNGIPYFGQLGNNLSGSLGLGLRIPIFNGYQARLRVSNAELNRQNQQYVAQNVKLQLRQTIEQAYANRRAAARRYQTATRQVAAREAAFKAAESRYNAGASNAVDFNLAKTNLDQARINQIQAQYDFLLRSKVLDYYMNRPLSF